MSPDGNLNYRRTVIDSLLPYARQDASLFLLIADMGFGAVDQFRCEFPDRVVNAGIMEQGMVGIAAGMAAMGLKPVVYCMVNFLAFRALEQIRNDVVLTALPVKFISTGANDYFRFLGQSHCCGQDDVRIFEIIGLRVYDPYAPDAPPFAELLDSWIRDPRPAYIRV